MKRHCFRRPTLPTERARRRHQELLLVHLDIDVERHPRPVDGNVCINAAAFGSSATAVKATGTMQYFQRWLAGTGDNS